MYTLMNLRKLIRTAYHTLSILNTAAVVSTGKPDKILRHYVRKGLVKRAGTFGVRYNARKGTWGR